MKAPTLAAAALVACCCYGGVRAAAADDEDGSGSGSGDKKPNECPDFDPYTDFTLYADASDVISPLRVGATVYLSPNTSDYAFFRLTAEAQESGSHGGNLVSDSDNDYQDAVSWLRPLDFDDGGEGGSPDPAGQFVTILQTTTAADKGGSSGNSSSNTTGDGDSDDAGETTTTTPFRAHYGFVCDGLGGEGRLAVLDAPGDSGDATRWWLCPTPEDPARLALKFGVRDGHAPEGCRLQDITGLQD